MSESQHGIRQASKQLATDIVSQIMIAFAVQPSAFLPSFTALHYR